MSRVHRRGPLKRPSSVLTNYPTQHHSSESGASPPHPKSDTPQRRQVHCPRFQRLPCPLGILLLLPSSGFEFAERFANDDEFDIAKLKSFSYRIGSSQCLAGGNSRDLQPYLKLTDPSQSTTLRPMEASGKLAMKSRSSIASLGQGGA